MPDFFIPPTPQLFCCFLTLCTALFQGKVMSRNIVFYCSCVLRLKSLYKGRGRERSDKLLSLFPLPHPSTSLFFQYQPLLQTGLFQTTLLVTWLANYIVHWFLAWNILFVCCKTKRALIMHYLTIMGQSGNCINLNFLKLGGQQNVSLLAFTFYLAWLC